MPGNFRLWEGMCSSKLLYCVFILNLTSALVIEKRLSDSRELLLRNVASLIADRSRLPSLKTRDVKRDLGPLHQVNISIISTIIENLKYISLKVVE